MAFFRTFPMNNSAILRINSIRGEINTSPVYQRNSEIWSLDKKQLLIDSILNDYDIPKLYFHLLPLKNPNFPPSKYVYAIIDGRQRIETIWAFLDNKFPLANEFRYYKDKSVLAANLTYSGLSLKYPNLKIIFDSFTLPIILVDTDDIDMIEEMFSRLNEAVPLNAAEKRNAMGGPMVKTIRSVAQHSFFQDRVKFSNHRYQHREVAARLLYLEDSLRRFGKFLDTKKPYLDQMVIDYKKDVQLNANNVEINVKQTLDVMISIFIQKDDLLASQASVPIYFLIIREALERNLLHLVSRTTLLEFRKAVYDNRLIAEQDITKADYDLLEFDRMSQQGTNDAVSIRERTKIIKEYLQFP